MSGKYCLHAMGEDPRAMAEWFGRNFGFAVSERDGAYIAQDGALTMVFRIGKGSPSRYGIRHVALNAVDIEAALAACREKGLDLDTDNGKCYHNACVWGTGTDFFNIYTPFDFGLEICQRLDVRQGDPARNIAGLEHVGVFVEDIDAAEAFYKSMGFRHAYPRTPIDKGAATVLCSMMTDGDLMLEVFAVKGNPPEMEKTFPGLESVSLLRDSAAGFIGPDGERFEFATSL